jgi:hypothetical protein
MKKILTFILLLCINTQLLFAEADFRTPEYSYQKMLLSQTPYKKYIPQLETLIPSLSSEKLESIYARVSTLTHPNTHAQILIDFIAELIQEELTNRAWEKVIQETSLNMYQKAEAEKEIATLQGVMKEGLLEIFDAMLISFEEMQHYEERWDLSLNMNLNIPEYMKYNLELALRDYISTTHSFDTSISGDIIADLDIHSDYINVSWESSGNIQLISKDGDIYIKVQDIVLNFTEMMYEELDPIIDSLNQLWKNNTYLKYEDDMNSLILESLETFSSDTITDEIHSIFSKNLLEAYAVKADGSYALKPTIEMCSALKQALEIFDPLRGETCSEKQYHDMLVDMNDRGISITLSPGKNKTLWVEIHNASMQGKLHLTYSEYGIISFSGKLIEPNNGEINNFSMSYTPTDSFSLNFNADEIISLDINGKLNTYNMISQVSAHIHYQEDEDFFTSEMNYSAGLLSLKAYGNLKWTNIDCEAEGYTKNKVGDFSVDCSGEAYDYWTEEYQDFSLSSEGKYDFSHNANNLEMSLDLFSPDAIEIYLQIKNTGTKKSIPSGEISIPTNIKSLDTFISEQYENMYENY